MIDQLASAWRSAGVNEGDMLLLHSDIRRTLRYSMKSGSRLRPDEILESFLRALGPGGTLLVPLFNFGFAEGKPFDIRETPSQMGVLTEAARRRADLVRTGHPIYSFGVLGRRRAAFSDIDNFSGYGQDSPFQMLRDFKGKIAVLDLPDQHSMTFYHHVEEICRVDYRYHKTFTGNYTDISGETALRTYGLFVRDTGRHVATHVDPAGEMMWRAGIYGGCRPGQGCGLRVASAEKVFEFVAAIIESGRALGTLYRIAAAA